MKTHSRLRFAARVLALAMFTATFQAAADDLPATLDIARIDADGKLAKPADLTKWVFLGTSLGMGYNPGSFNAANPGQFQVVLMEPRAYEYFVKNRVYAPGSMFLLSFYNADKQARSINQNGFTQSELTNYEIHLVGKGTGAESHSFYVFRADATAGSPLPPQNSCVTCHVGHGAFQATFAQFYPTIRPLIPPDALERALNDHDIR